MPGAPAGEEAPAAAAGEADPLVSNGLGSPACERAGQGELSARSRSHCETSGFVASAAPTSNYGIDVHIDKGVLGLSDGGLMSAVQDLFVTPLWMALVWAVHALVVMLEWCFTVDLLAGATAGRLGSALRRMESAFTAPWLALALAVASVLALYHGLIRRRVAETIGQVAVMTAMMAGGLWLILDPAGTVGALGQWADQAAIGTLATAAQGSPERPQRALGAGLEALFTTAVQAPWCYLEFGDVAWCRDPARLDPGLHRAALSIAALEQSLIGCKISPLVACATAGGSSAKVLQRSAELLRKAQSNGAIFLALPANGPARNSINDEGSLLRAICQASRATSCSGSSAAPAQFRTNNSTWSRVGGLLLIVAGLLGLLLLLGFLAQRLLTAAIFSLLYLLLTPAVMLAPAFGESGRMLFRRWGAQLLGTVVAKLIYSFLLGVVLAVLSVIASLSALGWWTQWLLMSALWWGAFTRRHQTLGLLGGGSDSASRRSLAPRFRMREARRLIPGRRRSERREEKRAPLVRPRPGADADRAPRATAASSRSPEAPERRAGHASAEIREADSRREGLIACKREQLGRVLDAREEARAGGGTRRAAELSVRGERIEEEIEDLLRTPAQGAEHDQDVRARPGAPAPGAVAQAPRAAGGGGGGGGRNHRSSRSDTATLAGELGARGDAQSAAHGREQHRPLDPRDHRSARAAKHPAQAQREELKQGARPVPAVGMRNPASG
ncbi:MAG: hypothetical protein H0X28_16680, partial [Solirubrobacterales bacterium]|nr:hypothetical protein [Solirubrobacterales bacterium]